MTVLYEKPLNKYSIDSRALALLILSFIGNCETGHKGKIVIVDVICIDSFIYIINQILTLIPTLCSHTSYTIRNFKLNALLITFSSCSFWERTTKRQCINYHLLLNLYNPVYTCNNFMRPNFRVMLKQIIWQIFGLDGFRCFCNENWKLDLLLQF